MGVTARNACSNHVIVVAELVPGMSQARQSMFESCLSRVALPVGNVRGAS